VSRREQIRMSGEEVATFLALERTVTCATNGPRGWPHLMPLWYVLRSPGGAERPGATKRPGVAGAQGEERAGAGEQAAERAGAGEPGFQLWAWTYAASQKTRNLERDPRATLQVEAGESYEALRGVMLECDVLIHRDLDTVAALGQEIFARYASPRGEPPAPELPAEVGAMVAQQAAKRVALQFLERRRASWDHRKLGGVY
jgi:hypothetical protein